MKIRNLFVALLLVAAAATLHTTSDAAQKAKTYACPKCEVASAKPGKCACGEKMIAVNGRTAYVCTHCNVSSKKAGNCAKCNMAMQKSLITYSCEGCKVSSNKPGKCAKCGGALHKHILPIKS